MRRRVVERGPQQPPPAQRAPERGERLNIPADAITESAVLARALRWATNERNDFELDTLLRKLRPAHFLVREHSELWAILVEVRRRRGAIDRATVVTESGEAAARYADDLLVSVEPCDPQNIDEHVRHIRWDSARALTARGPLPAFLEQLRDPRAEPAKVLSAAKLLTGSLEGHNDKVHIHDPVVLVRDQMREVERRVAGRASYPYGIPTLDMKDGTEAHRLVPGSAPGQITVLTANSGVGKTTLAARIALGVAFPNGAESEERGRRVAYCAWEMGAGMNLEMLACMSLQWSRTALMDPRSDLTAPIHSHEGRLVLEERMQLIAERITFIANPFRRRRGTKVTNDENLAILEELVAATGAELVIADLWKRCLRDASPEAEEDALYQQQAMAEELGVHFILLQQQRMKDIEARADKRPTREGIKGSSAYAEIADTILAVHRAAFWKSIPDDKLEVLVLKQRYAPWPQAVEFDWDADLGDIWNGRSVEYARPGEASEFDGSEFLKQPPPPGRRRR